MTEWIHKGEAFASSIYIDYDYDYDYEDVTYRWDHRAELIYVRFYGEAESPEPVACHDRLFNDALRFNQEISCEEYEQGFSFR